MKLRRIISLVIFSTVMLWPLVHMVAVQALGFSSWRLFGWGMYATPSPDDQTRLRVVILPPASRAAPLDLQGIFSAVQAQLRDPEEESSCVNLFLQSATSPALETLPRSGMCTSRDMTTHLDYFLHFSSQPHLGQFINEALNRANYSGAPALVFLSHQRLSLLRSQAYVESDVYQVQGNEVRALGRIRYEGNES